MNIVQVLQNIFEEYSSPGKRRVNTTLALEWAPPPRCAGRLSLYNRTVGGSLTQNWGGGRLAREWFFPQGGGGKANSRVGPPGGMLTLEPAFPPAQFWGGSLTQNWAGGRMALEWVFPLGGKAHSRVGPPGGSLAMGEGSLYNTGRKICLKKQTQQPDKRGQCDGHLKWRSLEDRRRNTRLVLM